MKKRTRLVFLFSFILTFSGRSQSWQNVQLVDKTTSGSALTGGVFWSDTGVIVMQGGYIIKSDDFWASTLIDSTYSYTTFWSIDFPNRDWGYLIAPDVHGGLLRTKDGGVNWLPVYESIYTTADWGNELLFMTVSMGYSIRNSSNDFYTTYDSGKVWNNNSILNTGCERAFRIQSPDNSVIYLLCNDNPMPVPNGNLRILKSSNNGLQWSEICFLNTIGYADFATVSDSSFFVVADNLILKSSNLGLSFDTVLHTNSDLNNIGGLSHAISFVNEDTGFVAFGGSIYKSTNAGNTWVKTDFEFGSDDQDNGIVFIKAISSSKVIVGCYNGNIYKTETGGGVWNDVYEVKEQEQIAIHPNPATTQLTLTIPPTTQPTTATITDVNGRLLRKEQLLNATSTLNIAELPAGLYFIAVQNAGQRWVRRFVKQ